MCLCRTAHPVEVLRFIAITSGLHSSTTLPSRVFSITSMHPLLSITFCNNYSTDPVSWELLQKRFRPNDVATCIRDIYDGAAYRKHSTFLNNPANISFTLNTDGVSLYRSSSISIWPVWLVVNELPPRKRYVILFHVFCFVDLPLYTI